MTVGLPLASSTNIDRCGSNIWGMDMMWVKFYATILIDPTPNIANAVSWRACFHDNRQGRSCQIYGRYGVSAIQLSWNPREFDTTYSIACAKYDNLAKSTRTEVKKALAGTDTSDLKATFCQDLSFSIPPLTLYCNHRPGACSNLIFGVPLVDVTINEDLVPKVMRLCIKEVEKRGLNTPEIYCLVSWSKHILGFVFSIAATWFPRRSSPGQWNPPLWPSYQLMWDSNSVARQVRKWKWESTFVQLYRQHHFRCDASRGQTLKPLQTHKLSSSLLIPHSAIPLVSSRATFHAFFTRLSTIQAE